MLSSKIDSLPLTVAVITRNSSATLGRALSSLPPVDQIIVLDGHSTDDTRDIAALYGAEVSLQPSECLSPEGKILDFSCVRNASIKKARNKWYFFIDHDEELTEDFCNELRTILSENVPTAFWVQRKYKIEGKCIACASTYPTVQMRLFHLDCIEGFQKPIHEKIVLKKDVPIKTTQTFMLVPLEASAQPVRARWQHYIALEKDRYRAYTVVQRLRLSFKEFAIAGLYAVRTVRWILRSPTSRMPLSHEWARIVYQWWVIKALWINWK